MSEKISLDSSDGGRLFKIFRNVLKIKNPYDFCDIF